MQQKLMDALNRARSTFGSFSAGQKVVTISLVVGLIAGGLFFARWAGQPTYGTLFSNLGSKDAAAIVEELTTEGVPYKLTEGGQTVQVPQEQVYDLRLKMSGAGLPAESDTGYALLDKQGVTTSDFMQHVGYQRALEGELTNTIKTIEGVNTANVHLAMPQKDVFADDAAKPTASVLVGTQGGRTMTQGQVQTIVHLVSSSVEGLSPDDVTVAGSDGTVLSSGGEAGVDAAGNTRSQETQTFEQRMNTSLQQMLTQVVGPGNAVVKVTADLDYDQTETKSQTYVADPDVPPLSESNKKETYTGGGAAAGGVLGPDNIQVPNGGNGDGEYESSTETKDNAVGMVTETRKSAPGKVRKLDVAVLLNDGNAVGLDTAQITDLVSSATGLDAERGDTIAVTAMPFDDSLAQQNAKELAEAEQAEQQAQWISIAKTGGMVLLVLLLALIAGIRSRRGRRSKLTDAELAELEEARIALEAARAAEIEGAGREAIEAGGSTTGPDDAKREAQRADITRLVEQQPDEVAQLLRGWLADRRS